jgi:3-oxoacyl-[acyl-carrier-protein] synthase II
MIVLEREDHARARGATIHASVDGYGSTCDAYHRVQMAPDGEEIVRAMSLAIERSGRARESIGFVSYHGTSTVMNDAVGVALRPAGLRRYADRLADRR